MQIACKQCNKEYNIPVEDNELEDLAAWQREMLISQTCDTCWNRMFPWNLEVSE
jgi:hypothetical protein